MKQPVYKFDRRTRNAVCAASDNRPTLGEWLGRIEAVANTHLSGAIDGIWCGREGECRLEMPGTNALLVVGWHNGRVEFSYIS